MSDATLQVPSFSWGAVPPTDRDWLKRRTEDIVGLCYRTACDIVRIGQALAEVRVRLKKEGTYRLWISTHLPFKRATAGRFIAVAAVFAPYIGEIERFEPCALYLLADHRAPPAIRAHALQLAGEGKRITRALALEILDAHRPLTLTKDEINDHSKRMAPIRKREGAAHRTAQGGADDGELALRWRRFLKLIEGHEVVTISRIDDSDRTEDGTAVYSVVCMTGGGTGKGIGRDLHDAVARAEGTVLTKFCRGCNGGAGAYQPISLFNRNACRGTGLNDRCRPCENERQGALRNRVRGAQVTAPAPAGVPDSSPSVPVPPPSPVRPVESSQATGGCRPTPRT